MPVGPPKTGGSWWRGLTECGPLEKGMATHFSILSFCLFILFMGFSRQEYWSGLPFPSPVDHILSDLSTMTHPSWIAPRAWLSFIELDKAVVLVCLDWLVFCENGFSVSVLWCPLATPTILLGFLLPWAWGISSQLLQQSTATAPYLGRGVSPYRCRSWPSTWDREDSTHGHHQGVNTVIRLIIFYAAKDGEALYSQQKQDQELTVAQIMNSLLPNLDSNWRK